MRIGYVYLKHANSDLMADILHTWMIRRGGGVKGDTTNCFLAESLDAHFRIFGAKRDNRIVIKFCTWVGGGVVHFRTLVTLTLTLTLTLNLTPT